jgi:hypothetical protein
MCASTAQVILMKSSMNFMNALHTKFKHTSMKLHIILSAAKNKVVGKPSTQFLVAMALMLFQSLIKMIQLTMMIRLS